MKSPEMHRSTSIFRCCLIAAFVAVNAPLAFSYALFSNSTDTISINGHTFVSWQMTMEARVLPYSDVGPGNGIIFQEQKSSEADKILGAGTNGAGGSAWTAAPGGVNGPGGVVVDLPIAPDAWHHLAFVRDQHEQRLYVDGVLVGTNDITGTPYDLPVGNSSSSSMSIGAFQYTPPDTLVDLAFIGKVDWVRVSGNARYSGDLVTPPTAAPAPDADTLVLFDFKCVAPGTTTVNDLSGNGFVGTVATGFSGATAPTFVPDLPSITNQPQSQVGYWGQSATFSVAAIPSPLSYQWQSNGVPILGATNQTLTLTNLQSSFAAGYTVVVSNPCGSVTSSPPATLTINAAPITIALYPGVTIAGAVGFTYGIQCSTNLADTNAWIGLDNFTLTQPTEIWYDSIPVSLPKRFYRVLQGPIPIP